MSWQIEALKAKTILEASIPTQWLLPKDKLPPSDQKNVADFPRTSGLFTDRELSITDMSATALVKGMGAGLLSAEEVVIAFLKRAVLGHQLLNFATEFLAENAIARAKELDAHYKRTGKVVGPLHGVPISVKEHIGMKNRTCNAGYVAWVNDIAPEDALILQCLHKAGAIFHVRTNQPQSLMHICCTNNLTGTTTNPYNRALSPGGSSGGEGASMGFRCAPLGIGTDIGGSIRCPAAFCNAYGFRPTMRRNPTQGIKSPEPGQEAILGVVGPLAAQSLDDLELFQRAVLDASPWDSETSLVPLPWKRVEEKREFTVGIMWDDGIVRPHPPITRALELAKSKLQASGIKVIDWHPYNHAHGWDIISTLYFPDAAQSQKHLLSQSNEPILPLTSWAFGYSRATPLSVAEAWALNVSRDEYRDEYNALMKERGVDFILCPAYVGVAAVLGESQYWNYTAIWNVLDFPAVVFPTGMKVEDGDVQNGNEMGAWRARSEVEEREWRKWWVDPSRYLGAPVGMQVVGRHFKDEETLAAAKVVEEVVCGLEGERKRV
ncbi:amidase signature domain-containing protein [Aspergillus coremiiformis]|uniref:amidase n=1 Tax=Aspergillus coremiiformis TaxID=138285 RepID=A0A5N6YU52_9EURO|nr:amidase signature domain-containing protein [Aspergillus coremiiformis]